MDYSSKSIIEHYTAVIACLLLAFLAAFPASATCANQDKESSSKRPDPLDRLIYDGRKLYEDGEYQRATKIFTYAARQFPQCDRPHLYLGLILFKQNNPEQSGAEADIACRLNPQSAQAHLLKGQTFLLRNQYDQAQKEFKQALNLDRSVAHCHYLLGRLYELQGLDDRALNEYKQAVSDDTNVRWALQALNEHLVVAKCDPQTVFPLEALGRSLAAAGQIEPAIYAYKQAADLAPASGRIQLALGILLAHKAPNVESTILFSGSGLLHGKMVGLSVDEQQLAIPYLKEASRLAPSDSRPLQELITIYGAYGDWTAAADLASRWVEMEQDSVVALWNLALCQLYCGDFYEAKTTLETALSLDPGNCELHTLKSLVWRELGKLKESDSEDQQALKTDADYLPALCNQIMSQYFAGKTMEAAEQFDQIAQAHPEISAATSISALLDAESGKLPEAEKKAQDQINLNASDDLAMVALATVQSRQGKLKEEIDSLQLALRLKPQSTLAMNKLSAAYLALGDYKSAADQAQQGLQLAPGNIQLKRALAMALGKQGNWYGAAFLLKEALSKTPKDSSLQSDLGYALEMKAQSEEAASAYQEALRLDSAAVAPRLGLARLAMQSKQFNQAIKQTDEVLAHYPFNDEARMIHGEANYRLGKFEDSIRDCGTALQHDASDDRANCLIGRSLYQVHRWSNALPYLWICIGKPDASAEEWLLTATAMKNVKDITGAQSVAQTGLSNYPEYQPLLKLLSQLNKLAPLSTPLVRK